MPLFLRTLITAMHFYRVIFQIAKFDHTTPTLIDLHWLPAVTFRIQFKLLLLVYKSLHNRSPSYSEDHCMLSLKPAGNYTVRSFAQSLLFVPEVNCSTWQDRTFAHTKPVVWNLLSLYHKNKLQSRRFFLFVGMVLIFSVKLNYFGILEFNFFISLSSKA